MERLWAQVRGAVVAGNGTPAVSTRPGAAGATTNPDLERLYGV